MNDQKLITRLCAPEPNGGRVGMNHEKSAADVWSDRAKHLGAQISGADESEPATRRNRAGVLTVTVNGSSIRCVRHAPEDRRKPVPERGHGGRAPRART